MHALARNGAFDQGLAIRNVCLPDRFIDQASPAEMYADAGMSAADIAKYRACGPGQKQLRLCR